jgi:hypothetical protein
MRPPHTGMPAIKLLVPSIGSSVGPVDEHGDGPRDRTAHLEHLFENIAARAFEIDEDDVGIDHPDTFEQFRCVIDPHHAHVPGRAQAFLENGGAQRILVDDGNAQISVSERWLSNTSLRIRKPRPRTGALQLWTALALRLAHRVSALGPQAWLGSVAVGSGVAASVAVASGVASSVAIDSGVASSVAIDSGVTASVAIDSGVTASVAMASGVAASVAVASGVTASVAVASGVAASVAAASGGVTTSSLVLMEMISLRLPAEAGVCVGSLEMAAGTGATRAETAMPLTIFSGKAAQRPRLWCE